MPKRSNTKVHVDSEPQSICSKSDVNSPVDIHTGTLCSSVCVENKWFNRLRRNSGVSDGSVKDLQKYTELYIEAPSTLSYDLPVLKRPKRPSKLIPICGLCLGTPEENKNTGLAEQLIACWECGQSGHPSCLKMPEDLVTRIRLLRWRCVDCKRCSLCNTSSQPNPDGTLDPSSDLLLCDSCDRGFHLFCLEPKMTEPPSGTWICPVCASTGSSKKMTLHDPRLDSIGVCDQLLQHEIDWMQKNLNGPVSPPRISPPPPMKSPTKSPLVQRLKKTVSSSSMKASKRLVQKSLTSWTVRSNTTVVPAITSTESKEPDQSVSTISSSRPRRTSAIVDHSWFGLVSQRTKSTTSVKPEQSDLSVRSDPIKHEIPNEADEDDDKTGVLIADDTSISSMKSPSGRNSGRLKLQAGRLRRTILPTTKADNSTNLRRSSASFNRSRVRARTSRGVGSRGAFFQKYANLVSKTDAASSSCPSISTLRRWYAAGVNLKRAVRAFSRSGRVRASMFLNRGRGCRPVPGRTKSLSSSPSSSSLSSSEDDSLKTIAAAAETQDSLSLGLTADMVDPNNDEWSEFAEISDENRLLFADIQAQVQAALPQPMESSLALPPANNPKLLVASNAGGGDFVPCSDTATDGDVKSAMTEESRYPPQIQLGQHIITTWYSAPYPSEYARLNLLYICEYCLKHAKTRKVYLRHIAKCPHRFPPGNEIYRCDSMSVFEVDGYTSRLYCQQLCLLAKLFLDHKTLYYDVEPFLFYVCAVRDKGNCLHLVGYFSKEKRSAQKYNLSCIMVLPPYQKMAYGRFLIDFSFLLSREEGQPGSPEKPLSDLGQLSYESYWRSKVLPFILSALTQGHPNKDRDCSQPFTPDNNQLDMNECVFTIHQVTAATGIDPYDVASTIEQLAISIELGKDGRPLIHFDKAHLLILNAKYETRQSDWIRVDEECLRWSPLIHPQEMDASADVISNSELHSPQLKDTRRSSCTNTSRTTRSDLIQLPEESGGLDLHSTAKLPNGAEYDFPTSSPMIRHDLPDTVQRRRSSLRSHNSTDPKPIVLSEQPDVDATSPSSTPTSNHPPSSYKHSARWTTRRTVRRPYPSPCRDNAADSTNGPKPPGPPSPHGPGGGGGGVRSSSQSVSTWNMESTGRNSIRSPRNRNTQDMKDEDPTIDPVERINSSVPGVDGDEHGCLSPVRPSCASSPISVTDKLLDYPFSLAAGSTPNLSPLPLPPALSPSPPTLGEPSTIRPHSPQCEPCSCSTLAPPCLSMYDSNASISRTNPAECTTQPSFNLYSNPPQRPYHSPYRNPTVSCDFPSSFSLNQTRTDGQPVRFPNDVPPPPILGLQTDDLLCFSSHPSRSPSPPHLHGQPPTLVPSETFTTSQAIQLSSDTLHNVGVNWSDDDDDSSLTTLPMCLNVASQDDVMSSCSPLASPASSGRNSEATVAMYMTTPSPPDLQLDSDRFDDYFDFTHPPTALTDPLPLTCQSSQQQACGISEGHFESLSINNSTVASILVNNSSIPSAPPSPNLLTVDQIGCEPWVSENIMEFDGTIGYVMARFTLTTTNVFRLITKEQPVVCEDSRVQLISPIRETCLSPLQTAQQLPSCFAHVGDTPKFQIANPKPQCPKVDQSVVHPLQINTNSSSLLRDPAFTLEHINVAPSCVLFSPSHQHSTFSAFPNNQSVSIQTRLEIPLNPGCTTIPLTHTMYDSVDTSRDPYSLPVSLSPSTTVDQLLPSPLDHMRTYTLPNNSPSLDMNTNHSSMRSLVVSRPSSYVHSPATAYPSPNNNLCSPYATPRPSSGLNSSGSPDMSQHSIAYGSFQRNRRHSCHVCLSPGHTPSASPSKLPHHSPNSKRFPSQPFNSIPSLADNHCFVSSPHPCTTTSFPIQTHVQTNAAFENGQLLNPPSTGAVMPPQMIYQPRVDQSVCHAFSELPSPTVFTSAPFVAPMHDYSSSFPHTPPPHRTVYGMQNTMPPYILSPNETFAVDTVRNPPSAYDSLSLSFPTQQDNSSMFAPTFALQTQTSFQTTNHAIHPTRHSPPSRGHHTSSLPAPTSPYPDMLHLNPPTLHPEMVLPSQPTIPLQGHLHSPPMNPTYQMLPPTPMLIGSQDNMCITNLRPSCPLPVPRNHISGGPRLYMGTPQSHPGLNPPPPHNWFGNLIPG